ncbi:MAG TPA: molybdenum cofactor biosynthesis protein MoaE [Caulobacteraceae bacterium]|jgi:molybdopterin synthase catalytic subunit
MRASLVTAPFDPGAALSAFAADRSRTGAVASFVGIARGDPGSRLELDAWPEFTLGRIEALIDDARRRFGLDDVAVIHRIGRIEAGEAIVLVMTAAAHRRAALEACAYLMDHLKSRAPLWKKEYAADGTSRWVEPTAEDERGLDRWDA